MSSKPIALARAFTKRSKRDGVTALPAREGSVRYAPGTISRGLISLPTELLSTTNVQALNAPDIRTVSTSSSSNSSIQSSDDSDLASALKGFLDTPITSPEFSSDDSSPATPEHPSQPSFFEPKSKRTVMSMGAIRASASSSTDAPAIPQRALSHSKQAHQELSRKLSISRMTPPPTTMPTANMVRSSTDFFTGAVDVNHPFSKELAQVNEVAEEFHGVAAMMDEEEELLVSLGLQKFGVEDYINEIEALYGAAFDDSRTGKSAWI